MTLCHLGFLVPIVMLFAPQPAPADSFDGKWRVQCGKDATTDREACVVLSAKLLSDAKNDFVQILVSALPDESYAILVRPNDGRANHCILRVDRNERFYSDSMLAGACLFRERSGTLIEQFKRGELIRIRISSRAGTDDELEFPLRGFADAFAGTVR